MTPLSGISQRHCRTGRKDYKKPSSSTTVFPTPRNMQMKSPVLEQFFRSGWYGMLTNLDGEYLMTSVRRMVRQEVAA